jgi:hypothetical protein
MLMALFEVVEKIYFPSELEVNQGHCMRVNSEVSELAAWSENCKWYSSLPLRAVV